MSEWISVEDRLPENSRVVILGFFDSHTDESYIDDPLADCFVQIGNIKRLYDNQFMTTLLAGAPDNHMVSLGSSVNPTHWTPLPDPPQDKG